MKSSEVFSLSGRVGFDGRPPPPCPIGDAANWESARIGAGPDVFRSREELEDAYAARLGEVVVRVWPWGW
jgi:hypothetical protein